MHLGEIVEKSEEGDDDETVQKSYASLGSCEVRAPGGMDACAAAIYLG